MCNKVALSAAIVGALALGAGLRTTQYVASTSLWHDELTVALNVEQRPTVELLSRPLAYRQVAPVGFLGAVKAATALFGRTEPAFRLVPWLSGLCAMFLFERVARRVVSGLPVLAAVTCFACSPALIWYGANLKPYSGDVAITLFLVWLALRFRERPRTTRHAMSAGLAGAVGIVCSFPAVPTALILCALLWVWHREVDSCPLPPLRWLTGLWAGASTVGAAAAFVLLDPATSTYMHRYWANGFVPIPSRHADWWWIPRHLLITFAHFLLFDPRELGVFGLMFVGFASAAAVAGATVLLRARSRQAALIVTPLLGALLASGARLLPFDGRVAVYAGWPLLLLAASGLQAVGLSPFPPVRFLALLATGVFAGLPPLIALTSGRPPYPNEESRPVLEQLVKRFRPGDAIYVYYGAGPAMEFYGKRLGLRGWLIGDCHRGNVRAYLREVDGFRGRPRVWFTYTHAALGFREPEMIRSYLSTIGVLRERIDDPQGLTGQRAAAADLYDLSDETRLASASVEEFDGQPERTGGPGTFCDGTRLDSGELLRQPRLPIRKAGSR